MHTLLMSALAVLLLIGAMAAGLAAFTLLTARRVENALPPAGHFIDVPGARLHVREEGSGPTLLMIHGLAGQMGHFTYDVVARLSKEFRVVTVDRPGSGYSERDDTTPADLSTQANAIATLIETMQLGRPVIVGHSLGGALALTLALEHPQRVAALALLAPLTHLQDGNEVPAAFKGLTIASPAVRKAIAWTMATPASIARQREILDQVFGPDAVPRDFATRGGGLLSLRPSQFLAASADLQALPARMPAIMSAYPQLRVPVSILFGRDDRILDWKINGEAFVAKVPNARLELIAGGHMLPVTHPAQTAEFIRKAAQRVAASEAVLK